jgi:glutamate synthase domain-containing protein 2/glutamate synthase domain-containing protein 3
MEAAARRQGMTGVSIPSASCRSVVYKGLVAGGRLAEFYPDLASPVPLRYATFHQRYATNTRPEWGLAQPFRWIAHNGEINTVRGNREQLRGRSADPAPSAVARRLLAAGPLLTPGGSDSLSLDEAVEALSLTGWDLPTALLALLPEAHAIRRDLHPLAAAFGRAIAGFLAPWDGPAALVFADGKRVGAVLDRNGLRPLAYAVGADHLVTAASEAGAIPLAASETVRHGRLGPGEMLLVDPRRGLVLEDVDAKLEVLSGTRLAEERRRSRPSSPTVVSTGDALRQPTPASRRYLAGLDAERYRLHLRSLALEGREPLWSMGDDTPTPGLARVDRPVTDHLRQAFAQVTNPPIDPEREAAVLDLAVDLGRRPPVLGGPRRAQRRRTRRLASPYVGDAALIAAGFGESVAWLDATWLPQAGAAGLVSTLERIAVETIVAAERGSELLVVSDHALVDGRLPVPSVLAVGAAHTALTEAGLRGRTDILVEAADAFDTHAAAMALAAGATALCPWLALEVAREVAGTRGAEELTADRAAANLLTGLEAGLRRILARMGISTAAGYIGGALFETLELGPDVVTRCFPEAPSWRGTVSLAALGDRIVRRASRAATIPDDTPPQRLVDPGLSRFRGDGELHLNAPSVVDEIQVLARDGVDPDTSLARYRAAIRLDRPATVRDQFALRPLAAPADLDEVESCERIIRRFVASAMSVGALSPEAHQAITLGIQRAGGAANTGEGGEDGGWYEPAANGERRDARIKQVASARFGVTAAYLARAEQIEIKIAQGSKPGEGGYLPARKATAWIAALRRGQPGQAYISPPPHHDIYSIEDLAQLIADLRAVTPTARIGVKLVACRGVGTIAAGVAKAGADYIHLAGHAGGTGASPLASIKHTGAPWELGLAEVHQVLVRGDLRDRVALRVDGGLRTGRDIVIAALLGAEEFAFATTLLIALGCDMARQCHLDTCPTGIATQRDDLRARFSGTPDDVAAFVTMIARDVRRELAAVGARSIGELVGRSRDGLVVAAGQPTLDLRPILAAPPWPATSARRAEPSAAGTTVRRLPASPAEERLLGQAAAGAVRLTTAERSFGARLSGAIERGEIDRPRRIELEGAAGQSLGAFLCAGVELRLVGVANDYVGKGLSGGRLTVVPEQVQPSTVEGQAIVGNTCLYGATAGRLHVVGRAGMRFAVRNAGADAVVEGVGAHACEYMTGGSVVILGPVGANLAAGMTGGRVYLLDPAGRSAASIDERSVTAVRLEAVALRDHADELVAVFRQLVVDHAAAGSPLAARLVAEGLRLSGVWLVEPIGAPAAGAAEASATDPQPARIDPGAEMLARSA